MILPVINIGTGYQIGLMWSSPLTQGIKIGLLGYGRLLRLSQDRMPIVLYDRPAIQAEAMTFFFFFGLSAQHPQSDRVYPRSTIIIATGPNRVCIWMFFSKVYCDSAIWQGQVLTPPPPAAPPYPVEKSSAPPPPLPGFWLITPLPTKYQKDQLNIERNSGCNL